MGSERSSDFLQSAIGVALLALLANLLWGSAIPCIKMGYKLLDVGSADSASQLVFAGLRFSGAGVMVLAAGSLAAGRPLLLHGTSLKAVLVTGLFQTYLQYVCFYIGVAHTAGVTGSIINGSNVFINLLIAALIFRTEKLTARKTAGVLIGFAGIVLVALAGASSGASSALTGFRLNGGLLILLSAVSAATASSVIKFFGSKESPVLICGWQFLLGGLALALTGRAMGGWIEPGRFTPASAALLVYMMFISAAAYTAVSVLLKYNPVSRVTVYGFSNPIFSAALSVIVLGERLRDPWIYVIALALVSIGILTVNRADSK